MIKLTDLLNESTPGFDKRKFGDALPTLDSVTKAHQAKLKSADLMKEESFTAVNKDSGKVSVFDTKDARDAAVKSGTHDKKKAAKGGDSSADKDTPKVNIFNKSSKEDDNIARIKKDIDNNGGKAADDEDEPKKTQGKLSKFIYGDDDKKPDVVAKPEGKPDLSKYSSADEDYFTKDAASISTIYDDKLTIDDLQNVFKAKGYGDVTDSTLDDIVDKYNDDEDMRDRFKDNGINKVKLKKRIKALKSQLQSKPSATKKEEPKKDTPTKDSTQQRAGNTEVNKSVRNQAKKLGITPAKLGKEEYQKVMVGAAYEALTDSNFSTEARQLLAVITGDEKLAEKPDYPSMSDEDYDTKIDKIRKDREAGDVYTTPENDKASELGQHSSSESSWSGADAIDAIAFDLKMNGYKDLAAKIQSVIKED